MTQMWRTCIRYFGIGIDTKSVFGVVLGFFNLFFHPLSNGYESETPFVLEEITEATFPAAS